jgi:hypothetical protein
VVAVQDEPARRHEVDAVHVERGRCRPAGVCLHHPLVDAPGIEPVGARDDGDADDNHPQRVHATRLPPVGFSAPSPSACTSQGSCLLTCGGV